MCVAVRAAGKEKGEMDMNIAVIGYIFGENKITVSYDTENEIFIVDEVYRDRDIGIKIRFRSIVESKEEVRESIQRFKKSFNK